MSSHKSTDSDDGNGLIEVDAAHVFNVQAYRESTNSAETCVELEWTLAGSGGSAPEFLERLQALRGLHCLVASYPWWVATEGGRRYNSHGKFVPCLDPDEGSAVDESAPVTFFFDDNLAFDKSGPAESGLLNLRAASDGTFRFVDCRDWRSPEWAEVLERELPSTPLGSQIRVSPLGKTVLVQVEIQDAILVPDFFSAIVRRFRGQAQARVFMDVNKTVMAGDTHTGVTVDDVLRRAMKEGSSDDLRAKWDEGMQSVAKRGIRLEGGTSAISGMLVPSWFDLYMDLENSDLLLLYTFGADGPKTVTATLELAGRRPSWPPVSFFCSSSRMSHAPDSAGGESFLSKGLKVAGF